MISFDKIVKKLLINKGSIINIIDIWSIIDPDYKNWNSKYSALIYKTIYRLKSLKIISPLKNWLYLIWLIDAFLIDDYYWKIVKKIIISETWWQYFIWWQKSLELLMKDFSLQSELIVYTKDIRKIVSIDSDHKIIFKIFNNFNKKKILTFNTFFKKFIIKSKIEWTDFNICSIELALLDYLHHNKTYFENNILLIKFINKFNKMFNDSNFNKLVQLKYISSINKLRFFAKSNWITFIYNIALNTIKTSWANCFLTFKK